MLNSVDPCLDIFVELRTLAARINRRSGQMTLSSGPAPSKIAQRTRSVDFTHHSASFDPHHLCWLGPARPQRVRASQVPKLVVSRNAAFGLVVSQWRPMSRPACQSRFQHWSRRAWGFVRHVRLSRLLTTAPLSHPNLTSFACSMSKLELSLSSGQTSLRLREHVLRCHANP